jgi:hypothetical protein
MVRIRYRCGLKPGFSRPGPILFIISPASTRPAIAGSSQGGLSMGDPLPYFDGLRGA